MIKFFRKIRQNLVIENKMGKYFKYAFGEIILVVIGILIALQINNWNEERKQNEKTKYLIERLINESKQNISQLNYYTKTYEKIKDNNTIFFNLFNTNIDSIKTKKLDSLFFNSIFDLNTAVSLNTLNEAMDNGEVSTIKNESLSTKLYQLKYMVNFQNERIKMINDDNNNFLFPFLYKNTNLRNLNSNFFPKQFKNIRNSKMKDTNYKLLFTNREFENLMTSRYAYITEAIIFNKNMANFIDKTAKELEEELKNY